MTSCAPCARAFDSPSALRQHLRSSAAHPFCAACDAGFMTEAGYLSVRAAYMLVWALCDELARSTVGASIRPSAVRAASHSEAGTTSRSTGASAKPTRAASAVPSVSKSTDST
jgi:hypothetical protein